MLRGKTSEAKGGSQGQETEFQKRKEQYTQSYRVFKSGQLEYKANFQMFNIKAGHSRKLQTILMLSNLVTLIV